MQAATSAISTSEFQLLDFPEPTFQSGGSQATISSIPPVDEIHFYPAYRTFCFIRGIKVCPPSCDIQNQPVELHRLHAEVLKAGGYLKVHENNAWDIIGGQIHSIQFPGTRNQPSRSGPEVAQQLAEAYREHLAHFEEWYTRQTPGVQWIQQNLDNLPVALTWSVEERQQLLNMCYMSVTELRARGVEERAIALMELNRAAFQLHAQKQQAFQQAAQMLGTHLRVVPPPNHQDLIRQFKQEFLTRYMPTIVPVNIPNEELNEYIKALEDAYRQCVDAEHKVLTFAPILNHDVVIRRLVEITCIVQHNRAMITMANPRFTLGLANLHILCSDLQRTIEQVMKTIDAAREVYDQNHMQQQIPPQEQSPNLLFISPSDLEVHTGSVTPSQPPNF